MLELLQWIFEGFWRFFGVLILIGTIGSAVGNVVSAWRGKKEDAE
jgi:hypothetical protein